MASDTNQNLVTEVIVELKKVIQEAREAPVEKESFWRFISYLEQLRPILDQLNTGNAPELPLRVQTVLNGIKGELVNFQSPLQICKSKSRLYLLTNCQEVVREIQKTTHGIGRCLARLPSVQSSPRRDSRMWDVGKKADDLAREMQQALFMVSASEERICLALEREASQSARHEDADSGVQNAILLDIGRELGLELDRNRGALFEQLQLLRRELADCRDRGQIKLLETIESMFQSWTLEPAVPHWHTIVEAGEDDTIAPFDTFLCPLSKKVMKDPVFLQSERTYERSAIENWFNFCRQQGRPSTCPVSGQVLTSTELRPSLVLRHTIQEWEQRNVAIRIRLATSRLGPTASGEEAEQALEDIILVADDSVENRRKLYEEGLLSAVLGLWQRNVKSRAHLRSRAIAALRGMVVDSQENKDAVVDMGALKLAVQSLNSGVEKERECAVGLLYELSTYPSMSLRIGSEKGAIVGLMGVTSAHNGNAEISNLAEHTLLNLENVDANALQMAEAGRLKPVLARLCQGSEETQVKLAKHLSQMILTNTSKEVVAETGGKALVRMLSISPNAREAALGVLYNLSTLEDTAHVLIKAGVIAHLVFTIFSLPAPENLKEMAISTLANLVVVPGSWETSKVDKEGHLLYSEKVLHKIFGLLQNGSSLWKEKILQTLYGIACSTEVTDAVAANICSCGGTITLVNFMLHSDSNTRLNALRLLSLLSVRIGDDIAAALRSTLQLKFLKEVLQLQGKAVLEERVAAATILANIPLTEFEVIRVLEIDMLQWTVNTLQDCKSGRIGRLSGRAGCAMQEALLGILLHFARNSNVAILNSMRELYLFTLFQEKLMTHWTPLTKERSAVGLQLLSERAYLFTLRNPLQAPSNRGAFFGLCLFPSKTIRDLPEKCDVHGGVCDPNGTFCLVAACAISPLIELLEEEDDYGVQEAAVNALSTLLMDGVDIKGGVEQLAHAEGVQPIFDLFYNVRQGRLQEKAVWMIDRILRVEEYTQLYSSDQGLVKALMEARRHGSPNTRALAQDALARLSKTSSSHPPASSFRKMASMQRRDSL